MIFQRFARKAGLEGYSRRQLMGKIGKKIILAYLEQVPKASWRKVIAILKMFWSVGLNMPWPVDSRQDLGRLPKIRRVESPPDNVIAEWGKALRNEKNPYLRLLWLLIAQHGWRPSHAAKVKWRNVRYDAQGRPLAIVADGTQEDFKTCAPVAARLAPDVAETLLEWKTVLGEAFPDKPILPWRAMKGEIMIGRELDNNQIHGHWCRLRDKWGLPPLRPKDCRHWVATTCRKAGLSKQASAYLMGHDPTQGGSMRDWYDSPQLAEIFDEQAQCLPKGPLGLLEPPEVRVVEGLPPEAIGLLRAYLDGQCGTMDFASRMESIRLKQAKMVPALGP